MASKQDFPPPPTTLFETVSLPCDPRLCACSSSKSCTALLDERLREFGLPTGIDVKRLLFHVHRPDTALTASEELKKSFDKDFEVLDVLEVENPFLCQQYNSRKAAVAHCNDGDANEKVTYHMTKASLMNVCNEGLDPRRAQRGFFGRGIYFANTPSKANDYSSERGNPTAVRAMLQCRVVLGKVKEYELGHFDRDLVTEPEGFNSVSGFMRRDQEFVVYNRDQVNIERVILYRYKNSVDETSPCYRIPPNVSGHVVYITPSLSEFFSKLQMRAGPVGSAGHNLVKSHVASLLQTQIDADEFLKQVGAAISAIPPQELYEKLRTELARCRLSAPATAAAPATAPAQDTTTATAPAESTDNGTTASSIDASLSKRPCLN